LTLELSAYVVIVSSVSAPNERLCRCSIKK